jgi:PAS domain S-box-containing protein
MIWMSGVNKLCTYVNQRWLEFTGRSVESELASGWAAGIHPEDSEKALQAYFHAFEEREPFEVEYRLQRTDGEYRWVFDQGVPRFSVDGSFAGYIGSAFDITERKLAEEALSTLSQKLIEAQEGERRRIARDLHDDLSQRLALHCADLDLARQGLPSGSEAARELARLLNDAQKIVLEVRRISHNLHHPQLALGLQHGATTFCREFSNQTGIMVEFSCESDLGQISETTSVVLFRVLQEALSNVAKHSGAERVIVSFGLEGDQVLLRVSDHGRGFDTQSLHEHGGLGLISMRERLRLVGGTVKIVSSAGQGTNIEASAPSTMSRGARSASA